MRSLPFCRTISNFLLDDSQGRFKDIFMDLVEQLKSDSLLPPKRVGPLVCIALIESSSHRKARLMACRECHECVERLGSAELEKKASWLRKNHFHWTTEKRQASYAALLAKLLINASLENSKLAKITRNRVGATTANSSEVAPRRFDLRPIRFLIR